LFVKGQYEHVTNPFFYMSLLQHHQQAAQAGSGSGDSYYLLREARVKRVFEPKQTTKVRLVINPALFGTDKIGRYGEQVAYFHEPLTGHPNGINRLELYCPKKNDGKPCATCDKEQALIKEAMDTRKANNGVKGERDTALFKQANNFQARKYHVLRLVEPSRLADGTKYWFIKDDFRKQGTWDLIHPVLESLISQGIDYASPANGRDFTVTMVERNKPNGVGTYSAVGGFMPDFAPTTLGSSQQEGDHYQHDPLEWRQLKKPLSIRGYYDLDQLLLMAAQGRVMPYWDKDAPNGQYKGNWVIFNEANQPVYADYDKSPEYLARQHQQPQISEASLQQAPNPLQHNPYAAPAQAAPAAMGYGAPASTQATVVDVNSGQTYPAQAQAPTGYAQPAAPAPMGYATPAQAQGPTGYATPAQAQVPMGYATPAQAQGPTGYAQPAAPAPMGYGAPQAAVTGYGAPAPQVAATGYQPAQAPAVNYEDVLATPSYGQAPAPNLGVPAQPAGPTGGSYSYNSGNAADDDNDLPF
jgi:hypothetical protein